MSLTTVLLLIVGVKVAIVLVLYVICDGKHTGIVLAAFALAWVAWCALMAYIAYRGWVYGDPADGRTIMWLGIPTFIVTYLWVDKNFGKGY